MTELKNDVKLEEILIILKQCQSNIEIIIPQII